MLYHPEDFLRLTEAIEDVGGAIVVNPCRGRKYRIKMPAAGGKSKWEDKLTSGCGNETQFLVPYRPPGTIKDAGEGPHTALVCAVCDELGKWPRFAHVIEEDSF